MNAAELSAADGSTGVDHLWKRKLGKLLSETPLAASLLEAVQPLNHLGIDLEDLEAVIEGKCEEWALLLYSASGGFRLPASYRVDFAVAIYVYTLEEPRVYGVVNLAMFNPTRRLPGAGGGISTELRACMPFVKYLDAALEALPPAYHFAGQVRRAMDLAM